MKPAAIFGAVVLAVSLGAAVAMLGTEHHANTQAAVTNAAPLPLVTKATEEKNILQATKPLFILVTTNNCQKCDRVEAMLSSESQKLAAMQFIKVDAKEFGVSEEQLPLAFMFVPNVGRTVQLPKFDPHPDTLGDFLAKRAAAATKQSDLAKSVIAANHEIAEKSKPFDDQLTVLEAQAKEAVKPFDDQLKSLRQQRAEAIKPFAEKAEPIVQAKEAATKALQARIDKMGEELDDSVRSEQMDTVGTQ